MAVIFVSHSSKDDDLATALEAWLEANGFTDIFIDHLQIAGGAKWREQLRASAGACRVVICIITENWLASDECFHEFRAAWYMGKRIIPLFLLPQTPSLSTIGKKHLSEVYAEYQGLDLALCLSPDRTLDLEVDPNVENRLRLGLREVGALNRVGLDPSAFEIDRTVRPTPFPGLASFGDDDADAALFYGRSREIAQTLEELRKMRTERDLRPFVILGASGAGKSSLLKAGIIPRLRREAPAWLPLRAFRPGADPLLNFAEALTHSLADYQKIEAKGVVRDRLFSAWSRAERVGSDLTPVGLAALEKALHLEGNLLRKAAGIDAATILISVDQAEELTRAAGESGDALADYLRVALATGNESWQLAFTIRTDTFPELQNHSRFRNLEARGYDLRAIPVFRFESVVGEPAKRYGVAVDQSLVDVLMEDAPKEDALPLLAFALQRLWGQYAATGVLTKDHYEKVGGLRGLIEDAAERALRGLLPNSDVPLPQGPPAKHLIDLAASTFVPALAQINDQGGTIRRIAMWLSFTDEQQALLTMFDQWRLVVRKGETGTVEVAHEALFREWGRLKSWLEPERSRLEALRSLQLDASAWDRNGRDNAFLNHRDKRLAEVAELAEREGYRERFSRLELDYVAACETAERLARRRTRRMLTAVGVLAFSVIAGVVGWLNQSYLRERMNWFMVMRPYMLTQIRPHVLTTAIERSLKPSNTFKECAADCPEMIVVPAGTFMMGSPETESGRFDNEGPQHMVTIVKSLAISRFDVTFADWDACVSVGGCPQVSDLTFGREAKPLINVTWKDAEQYVAWFAKMTGKPYRLLTEAEWEYAARAGTTTANYWGDDVGTGNANCVGCGTPWDKLETSPVGSFPPNAFGLFDMAGDVWQWVQDCYRNNYNGAPIDGSVWAGGDCSRHVVRGGSWLVGPQFLRSAFRVGVIGEDHNSDLGFRIARPLSP